MTQLLSTLYSKNVLVKVNRMYVMFQLDCGIHPGLSGMDALPFVDLIEANEIDLLLISQ